MCVVLLFCFELLSDFVLHGTASFRELGPPDLCHVVKSSGGRQAMREVCISVEVASYTLSLECSCFVFYFWFSSAHITTSQEWTPLPLRH